MEDDENFYDEGLDMDQQSEEFWRDAEQNAGY